MMMMCLLLLFQSAVDETLRRNIMATFFSAPINPGNPHLVLSVDRNDLVTSTLAQLTAHRHGHCDFKKPLKVRRNGLCFDVLQDVCYE